MSEVRATELSIVIPAYNEEYRLPNTLREITAFLASRGGKGEIIVVDDGSSDRTSEIAREFARETSSPLRVIVLESNRGKGAAVRAGVLAARGSRVLFADADGSTPIAEIERLECALDQGADVAIGSRAIPSSDTQVVTVWHRKFLGRCFNRVINLIILPGFADTQCGFKIFSAEAAQVLFSRQRASGWSFDLEILFLARKAGMRIAEVPINWHNVPGSKVNLIVDASKMLCDAILIHYRHRKLERDFFKRR